MQGKKEIKREREEEKRNSKEGNVPRGFGLASVDSQPAAELFMR